VNYHIAQMPIIWHSKIMETPRQLYQCAKDNIACARVALRQELQEQLDTPGIAKWIVALDEQPYKSTPADLKRSEQLKDCHGDNLRVIPLTCSFTEHCRQVAESIKRQKAQEQSGLGAGLGRTLGIG
jgi:hypothetical protein